jgi:HK97 family phage major capsid protein
LSGSIEGVKSEVATVKAEFTEMKKKNGQIRIDAPAESKSFNQRLKDAFKEKEVEIKSILDNNGKQTGPLRLELKDAVTISAEGTIGAGSTHNLLSYNTGIISTIRKRVLQYLQNVSVGSISPARPYAMWVEETDEQGAPIFIGEGDGKTQLSVRYEEKEKKAKKIAVYGKVTTEMLRYLPQLLSYIQNNLMKRVDIKTEDQLFAGDDTGDNLKGITEYASAFTGSDLAGTVEDANNFDVIEAIALQCINAYGTPNAVFVHPSALSAMKLSKATDGHYIMPPFASADGTTISGLRIIPTNALAADAFVGGDLSVVNVQFTDQMSIQIGLDGNDFTNNKKTIVVEQELVQFVSANDTPVIIEGTFTAAIALLNAA